MPVKRGTAPQEITVEAYNEMANKAALYDALQTANGGQQPQATATTAVTKQDVNGLAESEETKKLRDQLETAKKEKRNGEIAQRRTQLVAFAEEEINRQNRENYGSMFLKNAILEAKQSLGSYLTDERIGEWIDDTVYGEKIGKRSVSEEIKRLLDQKSIIIEEAQAQMKASQMITASNLPNVRINAMGEAARSRGSLREEAYWSDEKAGVVKFQNFMRDVLLSKMWKQPVKDRNGVHLLESHFPMLHDIIQAQQQYEQGMGIGDHHWFSPGGQVFNVLTSPTAKKSLLNLMEADEITTTSILGGTNLNFLPIDVSSAIIMATWPALLAQRIAATTGTMLSTTKRVYDYAYPRTDTDPFFKGMHFFGSVLFGALTTLDLNETLVDGTNATDQGAFVRANNEYPSNVYAYVGQVVATDTTITITGLNANGLATATATVVIKTTDAVGTRKMFIPTVLGDTFMDITAVSATTMGASGQVGIYGIQPITGHAAGSPAQKTGFKLNPYDLSEKAYDIQANMPISTIEDMQIALAAGGGQGLDIVATMSRLLSTALRNYIDFALFDQATQNLYANNILTFDSNNPDPGYNPVEWRERLHFNLDVLATTTQWFGGAQPNWMVWHLNDKPHYVDWLSGSDKLHKFDPLVNDPFSASQAQFNLVGCNVFISENMPVERVLVGSNNADTGIHYHVYVPFRILQALNPTAGMETVVFLHHRAAMRVINGRSLGLLKVLRR